MQEQNQKAVETAHSSDAEYVPPRTWHQFEELCADTFAAQWCDPFLVRYGRAGRRQCGLDIVARRGKEWPIALQCTGISTYPMERLTLTEIENEIGEALKFRPNLKSFYLLLSIA